MRGGGGPARKALGHPDPALKTVSSAQLEVDRDAAGRMTGRQWRVRQPARGRNCSPINLHLPEKTRKRKSAPWLPSIRRPSQEEPRRPHRGSDLPAHCRMADLPSVLPAQGDSAAGFIAAVPVSADAVKTEAASIIFLDALGNRHARLHESPSPAGWAREFPAEVPYQRGPDGEEGRPVGPGDRPRRRL